MITVCFCFYSICIQKSFFCLSVQLPETIFNIHYNNNRWRLKSHTTLSFIAIVKLSITPFFCLSVNFDQFTYIVLGLVTFVSVVTFTSFTFSGAVSK